MLRKANGKVSKEPRRPSVKAAQKAKGSGWWWKGLLCLAVLAGIAAWLEHNRTDEPIPGLNSSRRRVRGKAASPLTAMETLLDEHHNNLLLDITTFFEGPESDRFGKWWTDLTPDKRLEMMKKARELILTDSVVMMMLNQAEKTGKEFDSMVHKTFTIFAPELFAENVFSSDHAALAFLLRAVMDGQEHEYFNEDIGEEAAAGGDADAQAAAVGPKKRESLKAGMKAGPETEVMSEMDGMRKVYRSVLLSSFLQKLVLTFEANF